MRDDENTTVKPKIPRGRPREFNEDDVVLRLMNLFWDKGYEGTSLSDIVSATGLKKGSLYSLYGGKRDMYLKSLAYYNQQYVEGACAALRDKNSGAPRTRIDNFLSSPIKAVTDNDDYRGCFLCNAAANIAKRDVDVQQSISAGHDNMLQALEAVLREDNSIVDGPDIARRARALLVTYTGLRILVRANPDIEILQDAKKAALEF